MWIFGMNLIGHYTQIVSVTDFTFGHLERNGEIQSKDLDDITDLIKEVSGTQQILKYYGKLNMF